MKLFSRFKKPGRAARADEIQSRLLGDRIVFIGTPIDDQVANLAIAQMLFLESEDPRQDVNLYINSPGGAITASMAIFDAMEGIRPDVTTVCMGRAAGTAALLVARGTRGKRFALPTATFRFVPSTISGHAELTQSQIAELERMDRLCIEAFGKCLRRSREQIRKAFEGGLTLTSGEAVNFGIIDAIVRGGASG